MARPRQPRNRRRFYWDCFRRSARRWLPLRAEAVRRIIEENKLVTPRQYEEWRTAHPEKGLPPTEVVLALRGRPHDWSWEVVVEPTPAEPVQEFFDEDRYAV